jgi:hypothetical protein
VNDKPEFITIGGMPWRPGITISFTEDDAATEEQWFNFTVTGLDADITHGEDDEITYMVSRPEKVLLTHSEDDPLTATLSFYPTNDEVGKFSFSISIKDKSSKNYLHETIIEIQVRNTNDKPEILSLKKLSTDDVYEFPESGILDLRGIIKVKQDDILTLMITASDPDLELLEDSLTFHADALDFISVDANTNAANTAKVIINPKWNNIGLLKFNVSVKDTQLASDSVQIILNVDNVNDKPIPEIDLPAVPDTVYYQDADVELQGDVIDYDIDYGDEITFTWSSDVDGILGYGKKILTSNLTLGKHYITLKVEDSEGAFNSKSTTIIIREVELPPEEEPEDEEESDFTFIILIVVMVVIIVVMLLVLFLVLRKKKKDKLLPPKPEEKKPFQYQQQPAEQPTSSPAPPTELQRTGTPGVIPTPTQYVPPSQGIPQTQPQQPQPQPQIQAQEQPQLLPEQGQQQELQFVPPQITTCPKCNNVMTFSPDGSPFCIACGYTPGK